MERNRGPGSGVLLTMRRSLAIVLLAVLATLVGACALVQAPASGPLVTVEYRGGECPEGMCETVMVIERDGRVHRTVPDEFETHRVDADAIRALEAAIVAADFGAIRARPFTGECPVNFDGQEVIYTFSAPSGEQRLASCEIEIDPEHPLFFAVDAVLGAATN